MNFPDHNGQETAYIQQVNPGSACICEGPLEVMGKGLVFLHHADTCPVVKSWLKRSKYLSANRHNFKEYGYPA